MSHELPLGKAVDYPGHYAPQLLAPIPRTGNRAELGLEAGEALPFAGWDIWNMYELSWLDPRGLPRVAMLRLCIPCDSPNIVESKSLKLYFNSLNQTSFAGMDAVLDAIRGDLAPVLGVMPEATLLPLDRVGEGLSVPAGTCLDELEVDVAHYHPEPSLLRRAEADTAAPVSERLYSNLFRSNCPITHQPDWATVGIDYRGAAIDREGLLGYLVSYRQHNDFHENCVERIYLDIMNRCRPDALRVTAHFTRRGGIDINPVRSSDADWRPDASFPRFARQ